MSQSSLPIDVSTGEKRVELQRTRPEEARLRRPVRNQIEMMTRDLDSLIAVDHAVRAIWDFLDSLDLSDFYTSIKAVLERPGRPAIDPQVLLALWVYATVDGVGSARRLEKLCQAHDAYRWLCGGISMNYHTLADFRVAHQEALDRLLTDIVAMLMSQDLVTLKQVAQDGENIGGVLARSAR